MADAESGSVLLVSENCIQMGHEAAVFCWNLWSFTPHNPPPLLIASPGLLASVGIRPHVIGHGILFRYFPKPRIYVSALWYLLVIYASI